MTDKVLITNNKTGSMEVKQIGFFLPLYDLGDVLGYKISGTDEKGESEVVGLDMNVTLVRGEVLTAVIYELANGVELMEEEVEYYYCDTETQEDVETEMLKEFEELVDDPKEVNE